MRIEFIFGLFLILKNSLSEYTLRFHYLFLIIYGLHLPHSKLFKLEMLCLKFDINMNQIKEFKSCTAAAKFMNVHKGVISRACLKNWKYNNFYWKYEKDVDN